MKLRIVAAAAVGIILIGILAWPLAAPSDPFGVVSVFTNGISFGNALTLVILAILAGFIAYFLSWPYGREIGILAVPFGLAIWALRSGNMASLMQLNPTLAQRQQILATLKWEPVFWLAVVAAGFAGVLVGQKISQRNARPVQAEEKSNSKSAVYLNVIIALVGSVLLAQFCIRIFARDVQMPDKVLGAVVAQPAIGQITFALLVSFGIVAFVVKKFLNVSYIWPIVSSALLTGFVSTAYLKQNVLEHLVQRWPQVFFPHPAASILPVQMVAFGTLGSIVGYWLAIRYNYWRKHG
jgi:hypothetical protein